MKKSVLLFVLFTFSLSVYAYEVPEKDWGIAVGFRIARIPFATQEEQVADVLRWRYFFYPRPDRRHQTL